MFLLEMTIGLFGKVRSILFDVFTLTCGIYGSDILELENGNGESPFLPYWK